MVVKLGQEDQMVNVSTRLPIPRVLAPKSVLETCILMQFVLVDSLSHSGRAEGKTTGCLYDSHLHWSQGPLFVGQNNREEMVPFLEQLDSKELSSNSLISVDLSLKICFV